jgi:hypothetical protein
VILLNDYSKKIRAKFPTAIQFQDALGVDEEKISAEFGTTLWRRSMKSPDKPLAHRLVFRELKNATFVSVGIDTTAGLRNTDNILEHQSSLLKDIIRPANAVNPEPVHHSEPTDLLASDESKTEATLVLERSYATTKEDVKFMPLDIVGKSKPNCHVLVNQSIGRGVSIEDMSPSSIHYDRVLVQYSDYNNSYRNTVRA